MKPEGWVVGACWQWRPVSNSSSTVLMQTPFGSQWSARPSWCRGGLDSLWVELGLWNCSAQRSMGWKTFLRAFDACRTEGLWQAEVSLKETTGSYVKHDRCSGSINEAELSMIEEFIMFINSRAITTKKMGRQGLRCDHTKPKKKKKADGIIPQTQTVLCEMVIRLV